MHTEQVLGPEVQTVQLVTVHATLQLPADKLKPLIHFVQISGFPEHV